MKVSIPRRLNRKIRGKMKCIIFGVSNQLSSNNKDDDNKLNISESSQYINDISNISFIKHKKNIKDINNINLLNTNHNFHITSVISNTLIYPVKFTI